VSARVPVLRILSEEIMKMKMFGLLTGVLALAIGANAQSMTTTEGGLTGAGFDPKFKSEQQPHVKAADTIGGEVVAGSYVKVYPAFRFANGSEDIPTFISNAVSAVHDDRPVSGAFTTLSPAQFTAANGEPWLIYDIYAGTNAVTSLGRTKFVAFSSELYQENGVWKSNNIGETFTFPLGKTYAPGARAYTVQDKAVIEGSAAEEYPRIIVAVGLKRFTATEQQVKQFLYTFKYWSVKGSAYKDDQYLGGITLYQAPPKILPSIQNNSITLGTADNGDPNLYDVQMAFSLSGPWTASIGRIGGTGLNKNGASIGPVSGTPAAFFRYMPPTNP
jgi:hypothetical protein